MKQFSIIAAMILLIFSSCNGNKKVEKTGENKTDSLKEVVYTDQLRFCESVLPYNRGILIGNFGSSELNPLNKEGKGYIVYLKDDSIKLFIKADGNLNAPRGMFEKDGYLFIADVNKVVVYNLMDSAAKPVNIRFPKDELFVNDLAAEKNTLYASVTNTGNIFKIDISDLTKLNAQKPVLWSNVVGANGILIDRAKMYVASYPAGGITTDENLIYIINDLQKPVAEQFISTAGQYDGIALSADKKILYVTNWSPEGLEAIDIQTKQINQVALTTKVKGIADIYVVGNKIYIPDLAGSQLIVKVLE
ncbi:MAG: LVIVD repeat-containing protein [Paludibacteraceae bacterium]